MKMNQPGTEALAAAGSYKNSAKPIFAIILTLLGMYLGLSDLWNKMWYSWMTDPLRSVGIFMPVAAAFFAFRKASALNWDNGNWWGIVLMGLPIAFFWLTHGGTLIHFGKEAQYLFSIATLPFGVAFAIYLAGAAIFFCGMSGMMALRFPLILIMFVNPVPMLIQRFDLPLQIIAAQTARAFASLLSVPVEPGLLKMMFAPNLGMFIAPGCNGMRGVATMMCLSLIIGGWYRLTAAKHTILVAGAMLLAYLFNLLRLCFVVIYYWFALKIDAIAKLGEEIDYVIGGVLFFFAVLIVNKIAKSWRSQ